MAELNGARICGCKNAGCGCTFVAPDAHLTITGNGLPYAIVFNGIAYDNTNSCGVVLSGSGTDSDPLCAKVCPRGGII